ncbi:MAG TPA: DUF4329 domain-containing protein, partial [Blastocatellia bacterium]|nr:DUF4329 domain-containing protein [Blastocatellia bacterium]
MFYNILAVLCPFAAARPKYVHFHRLTAVVRQIAITGLMVVVVSNQILAGPAPMALAGVLTEFGQETRFWWYSSGWAKSVSPWWPGGSGNQSPKSWDGKGAPRRLRPGLEAPERKEARERRIAAVKIYPGDVRIETGEQVVFNAVAYDRNGATISGIEYQWEVVDESRNAPVKISSKAVFSSPTPGRFRLTVNAAGHRDQTVIMVEGVDRSQMLAGQRIGTFSTDGALKEIAGPNPASLLTSIGGNSSKPTGPLFERRARNLAARIGERQLAAAASPLSTLPAIQQLSDFNYTWNGTNIQAADDPGNERGNQPGRAINTGLGSGNHQFSAPIIGLDGRGPDLNLEFHYNSRLWTKIGALAYFDIDKDLVPGWTLGFGKIIVAGNTYVIFDGDGTRHSFAGSAYSNFPSPAGALQSFEGYTTDGTFINYYAEGYKPEFSGGQILKAWAKLPNGTTIDYGASTVGAGKTGAIFPTQITDANGNYISITYRNNQGPEIETITDSLGRIIRFHYDGINRLTAITAPGMLDENGNSQPRTLIRLTYETKDLYATGSGPNYGFLPRVVVPMVRNRTFTAIKAIYYPATNTGYWFGDADSYSPYGMIRKVSERRGMTFSGPEPNQNGSTDEGTITPGTMSQEVVYNHPTSPGYSYPHKNGYLSEVPTFTEAREEFAARETSAQPVTYYSTVDNGANKTLKITRPDGTRVEQVMNDDPNSPFFGVVQEDRTYAASSGALISKSKVSWEFGDYNSLRPNRTDVTDDRGQVTYTTYTYGSIYNQVTDTRYYGYSGTLLRRVHNEYENDLAYRGSLINSGTLWWHPGGALYDGPQWSGPHLFNLVKVAEVYGANDTTRESRIENEYDQQPASQLEDTPGVTQHASAPDQRGNLTSTTQYANASSLDLGTAVVETRSYDVCGNLIKLSASCCERTTFEYTVNTQYAWPETTTRGSASDSTKQNTTSAVYDFNTGLVKESTDINGRRSSTVYQPNSLRPEYEYASTGAYTYHIYDDANLVIYDIVYEADRSEGDFASRTDKYLDGQGRVHGEIAYGKDYVLDIVATKYDNLGRLWQQTRPYRNGDPPQWSTYEYDSLDRLTKITAPDGSVIERYYNESAYPSAATQGAAGQTIRIKDPWNRERWARFDDQNRLVEVVEPDPNGNGAVASNGLRTNYTYNTLGNLIQVNQGSQTRLFKYDNLSRLTHQKLAERDATLDDKGQYAQPGQWTELFTYDTKSNLIQRTDARGVKTYYLYQNDPLNRLQGVQYDKSGVPSSLIGEIPDAPNVTYSYMTDGDKLRVQNTYVDYGMGNQAFKYDSEGRLAQATITFSGRESYPLATNYLWDSLDRVKEFTYPKAYGAGDSRKKVEPSYDIANRFDSIKVDDLSFASDITYNAEGQTTSLSVGDKFTESTGYDGKTGLQTTQRVVRGTEPLLDLKYNYTRDNDSNNNGAKTGQLVTLTDLRNQARNRAFDYDKLGRLKAVKGGASLTSPEWSQSYAYDRYGNRTTVTRTGSPNIPLDGLANLSYSATSNRITTAGFEYDPAGNQTKAVVDANGTMHRYRYDSAGRLAQVINASGQVLATYGYGANNQRLLSNEGGFITYFGWDGDLCISEYSAAGTGGLQWRTNYIYLGDRLLASESASGTLFHHPGRLGTMLVTDASNGEIVTDQLTLPFGTMQPFSGTLGGNNSWQHPSKNNPVKRRFTSYDRSDVTGLDYAVNRSYSVLQGRFTQVDPIEIDASSLSNPQTLNLYAYCGNDPINNIDPDGLLFGFLKKVFKGISKVLGTLVKAVKVVTLAVTAAYAVLTLNVPLLLRAGLGLLSEFGPRSLRTVAGFASGVLGTVSGGNLSNLRTPGTISGGATGGVNSFVQRSRKALPLFYRQAKDAFVRFIRNLNRSSRDANIEFGGSICRASSGNVYVTSPNIGTDSSVDTGNCAGGETRIGTYHTHAAYDPRFDSSRVRGGLDYNEEFSNNSDIPNADSRGVPSFLATPKRRVKVYIPNSS